MSSDRPDRAARNAEQKRNRLKRKSKRRTEGLISFENAVIEAEYRSFILHPNAEAHWNAQTVKGSKRKLLMTDDTSPTVSAILSGTTSKIVISESEKADQKFRTRATKKARGTDVEQHYKEASAIKAAMQIFNQHGQYEWKSVPDGLGADLAVRLVGDTLWAPIQVKSAICHPDDRSCYMLYSSYGDVGGKYEKLMILAVGLKPFVKMEATELDEVQDAVVEEIFLFSNANDMPGKSLQPYPRKQEDDKYADSRWVFNSGNHETTLRFFSNFEQIVRHRAQYTMTQIWFQSDLNRNVCKTHQEEVLNLETLAAIVGLDNLRAPWQQNQCTDILLETEQRSIAISLKTASVSSKIHFTNFSFGLGYAPGSQYCDYVMVFYKTATGERTHISVVPAKRAYKQLEFESEESKRYSFNWSTKHKTNKDVWENKMSLADADIRERLIAAMPEILRSHERTG